MKKKQFSDKWIDYNILKEYCKKCPDSINVDNLKNNNGLKENNINNIFYNWEIKKERDKKLNLENKHSVFLAWLFNSTEKKDIHYHCIKGLLSYLEDKCTITPKKLSATTQHNINGGTGIPDIILFDKKDENDDVDKSDFVIVIENKLDAKINTVNGTTQIENYYKYFSKKFKISIYLYFDPKNGNLERDIYKVCKIKKDKDIIIDKVKIKRTEKYIVKNLLNKFHYKFVEYSDIILIIYNALNRWKTNIQNEIDKGEIEKIRDIKYSDLNKCLNKLNDREVYYILKQYIEYWELYSKYIKSKKESYAYSKIIDVEYKDGNTYGVFSQNVCDLK